MALLIDKHIKQRSTSILNEKLVEKQEERREVLIGLLIDSASL